MAILPPTLDSESIAAQARGYADLFTLPLKDRNWRGNPGDYAGLGVGSSLDFQDHRNYLPGDDPRHINWQAFARTGDYSLKLYREEVRPVVEIIFDVSGSMFALPDKATRAIELLYFAFASAAKAGASAHVFLVKGNHGKPVEAHSLLTHHWQEIAESMSETSAAEPPNLTALPFRARSMRLLISDLLFTSPPEATVRALQRNNGRALILCPYAKAESDPGWEGNYEFVDSETATRHDRRVDTSLLRKYLETYRRHFDRWKAATIRARAPLARINAAGSFEDAMKREAIPTGAIQLA